jgi:hypothetical protein
LSASAILDANRVKYYGEKLSENIAETPEGYLICRNTVIGRTGSQKYLVSELSDPDGLVKDRGPGDEVEVWREPDQVFSPATLASFEGKTFTVRHPQNFLGPDDEREHHAGHVQHVRKGDEPLQSGDWPILADILVTGSEAIQAIRNGDRQLSCGYSYRLYKAGDRLEQREIIGNHVALVESARAGKEARINDSAPRKGFTVKNPLKHLFGLGLKEFSKTTDDPEAIATMVMDAMPAMTKEEGKADPPQSQLDEEKKDKADKEAEDKRKAKDAMKSCDEEKKEEKGDDRGARMHKALDLILANENKKKEAVDVDLDELGKLMGQYFQEEKGETEHQTDAKEEKENKEQTGESEKEAEENGEDEEEVKPISEEKAADKEEEKKEEKAEDDENKEAEDAEIVQSEPELAPNEREESQMDEEAVKAIVKSSQLDVLKRLRPIIARTKDKTVHAAFDTALRRIKAGDAASKNGGTYKEFAKAAERSTASDQLSKMGVDDLTPMQKRAKDVEDIYKKAMETRMKSAIRAK